MEIKKTLLILFFGIITTNFSNSYVSEKLTLFNQGEIESSKPTHSKTLVLFWASWCKSCKTKMKKDFPNIKNRDFNIITVATDKNEKKITKYIKKHKIEYPVYIDKSREIQKKLKIFSAPAWAVYQKDEVGKWKLTKNQGAFKKDEVNKALGKDFFL